VEASFDLHPHPLDWLHIENTFSLVTGKLDQVIEGTKFLPFIPAPRLQTEIRGNFNKIGSNIKNLYVKFELDNTFAQKNIFSAFNTETATPGYTLLNGGVGTDFANKKGQSIFSLFFSATNITDVAYQNHLSRLKYAPENITTGRTGIFNMGRNFSIKINIPLSFNLDK
jgi:iron complex outermembrane receptor protein